MSLFAVSKYLCTRCGACIDECPVKIIVKDNENYPSPAVSQDEACIDCGHCVAVCPDGALYHRSMSPDDCPPVRKTWLLSPEQAEHFLRDRRSIRTFKKDTVEKSVLTKMIAIACHAPSGHNLQPVKWLVLYDSSIIRKISYITIEWMKAIVESNPALAEKFHMNRIISLYNEGNDMICRYAPHLVCTFSEKSEATAKQSSVIAMTYLELAASSFGLGACWAGYISYALQMSEELRKLFPVSEGHIAHDVMMVGYPAYKYTRLMLRKEPEIIWE